MKKRKPVKKPELRRRSIASDKNWHKILLRHINDAVFVHRIEDGAPGKFLDVNEAACRQLGFTRKELLRMSVKDIDPPEQHARHQPIV